MKNEAELTLTILGCYLKDGPVLSLKDLCVKTRVPEQRIKHILSILEKRGYLTKAKNTDEYILTKKIVMLI
ncbi:MarR family transcriptional regulator [bacterium]|nr:MarR family transcriptional regulator [bacterium]